MSMRPEGNPLDLNNLPDDYSSTPRYAKQTHDDTSSSAAAAGGGDSDGYKKKKSGTKDGSDSSSKKVYECRFCSLKFSKSQALGGHMNRHRQERETETLNRARQLVFTNDSVLAPPPPHNLGGFHHQTVELPLQYRPVYPRLFHGGPSSSVLPPQQNQPFMYTTQSRLVPYPQPHYPQPSPTNDYFIGHVLRGSGPFPNYMATVRPEGNYTCIGAPVRNGFVQRHHHQAEGMTNGGGGRGSGDTAILQQRVVNNDEEGEEGLLDLNANINITSNENNNTAGRGYSGTHHHRVDSSLINRYQDGF